MKRLKNSFSHGLCGSQGFKYMDHFISRFKSVCKNPCNLRNLWLKPIIRMVNCQTTFGASQLSTINCQLSTLLAALLLTACTQAEMMYRQVVPGQGLIHIRPDMSVHTLPAQTYYFYNLDGVTPSVSINCDGYGNFSGTLAEATYHVIASNASVANAVYSGMDSHQTAMVYAGNLSGYSHNRASIPNTYSTDATKPLTRNARVLGEVYRVVLENLSVSAGDTLTLTPTPYLLTRRVTLNFSIDSDLQDIITALSGTLPGVYPSVHLFTGKTVDEEIARAPELQIDYIATPSDNDISVWSASIALFGLCDPEYGDSYRNISTITLTTTDMEYPLEVDLTDALSQIMEQYEGELPVDIPIQLNIELTLGEVEISAVVQSWSYVGGGGIEITIPIDG